MSFHYIDVHTHVNLEAFDADWEAVSRETLEGGVAHINVGTGRETSARAVTLARTFPQGVFATVGLHPVRAGGEADHDGTPPDTFTRDFYEQLAQDEKVVAIGECGFDFYRVKHDTRERQEEAFIAQIKLANDLKKPLMLHIRDVKGSMGAYDAALSVLREHAKVLGNVHFFAGTYAIAKQFWEMGFTTSFTGVITFTNEYDEVIKNAPLEMLHGETDAPYVAPVPYRGHRNVPLHVREVVHHIAMLRGEDTEFVRSELLKNAQRLFGV